MKVAESEEKYLDLRIGERIVEITDEREPYAEEALSLIAESFPPYERHSLSDLRSQLAEKRLDLLTGYDFHLMTMIDATGRVTAVAIGIYLASINAGVVMYLAVRGDQRGRRLGRRVRTALVGAFLVDARRRGRFEELAWVLGEVSMDSRWLHNLVRHGGAIPFHLTYYHPGMSPGSEHPPYVLYREPVGDTREELPATLVRQILYGVWRRAYRIRYPLQQEAFRVMLRELEVRDPVGAHPEVLRLAALSANEED